MKEAILFFYFINFVFLLVSCCLLYVCSLILWLLVCLLLQITWLLYLLTCNAYWSEIPSISFERSLFYLTYTICFFSFFCPDTIFTVKLYKNHTCCRIYLVSTFTAILKNFPWVQCVLFLLCYTSVLFQHGRINPRPWGKYLSSGPCWPAIHSSFIISQDTHRHTSSPVVERCCLAPSFLW